MPSWTEAHHHRAAEFVQLLATAIGQPPATPAATPPPRAPAAPAQGPKPAAPTAAAVFKTIPWKK